MSVGDNDLTARLVELRELFRRQFQNGSDNRVCEEALHIAESLRSRLQAAEKVVEAVEHLPGEEDEPCSLPVEVDQNQWIRCGGCFPCLVGQARMAATNYRKASG